ncbi:methyltransferase domain-containing protein [Paenibacillus sp. NEAU-GSW1]|uniref:methyltransferase domain-containing protein n=1 Tax=Paenibacillus sp. NEAU-GSW1 TaxID=2682486 RepID=UPI0012E27B17|nr:methyltransferase domain-containing protein [Paenibacillus sp. NEAU-GSW1]MUT65373.1 methyltransferase domain-containing protein [Paenibacillus sp. NEAU-GSW1]
MIRAMSKEWLDNEESSIYVEPEELEISLREVWNVNRYLGGNPALFAHLDRMIREIGRDISEIRMLDVATGLADIPMALSAKYRKNGMAVSITGVDTHPGIVELASRRTEGDSAVNVKQADGTALPFEDGSFDIAFCNLALHHMNDEAAVKLLQEMNRVARAGWVITDLVRHPLAFAAAKMLARYVWRSPVTKHDGPLSVQRSYTANEAAQLVRSAGVDAVVKRHFPFRIAIACYGERGR